jgi:hypothetical protein
MLMLPITLVIFGFMQRWQARHVFRTLDIHPKADKRGFLAYLFAYQVLTSLAALRGYGHTSPERVAAGGRASTNPAEVRVPFRALTDRPTAS